MTNEKIIEDLRQGKSEKPIAYLSSYFSKVKSFVLKYGGSENDAKDLFQEALIVFYTKV